MFPLFHVSTLHSALNSSVIKCDSKRKNPSSLCELPDFAEWTETIESKSLLYSDRRAKTRGIQEGAVNFTLFFSDFSSILCYRFSVAFRSYPHILDCPLLNMFWPVGDFAAWLLCACLQSRQQASSRETSFFHFYKCMREWSEKRLSFFLLAGRENCYYLLWSQYTGEQ